MALTPTIILTTPGGASDTLSSAFTTVNASLLALDTALAAKAGLSAIPTTLSALTNDAGFVTLSGARAAISVAGDLAYNPATGVITYTGSSASITSAAISDAGAVGRNVILANDATTLAALAGLNKVANKSEADLVAAGPLAEALALKANVAAIPTKLSALTNDSGFVTAAVFADAGFVTGSALATALSAKAGVETVPTTVSALTNDAGFVTQAGARAAISVTGALSYSPSTGILSYTAPALTSASIVDATAAATANTLVKRDASGNFTASNITASVFFGRSTSTVKLYIARTIALSGEAAGSVLFDGSANVTIPLTLAPTDVAPGTYGSSTTVGTFSVDAKGRLTAATSAPIAFPVTSVFGRSGAISLTPTDVSTALGFTPPNPASATTFSNDVTITGNLTVQGTTTTVNVVESVTNDTVFALARSSGATLDGKDRGIEFRYGTGSVVRMGFIGYNPSSNRFSLISDATLSNGVYTGTRGLMIASITGNAGSAAVLTTARTIGLTGDGTASISFDGSANVSGALTLAASGVAAGAYGSATEVGTFVVDAKGRLTGAASVPISFPVTSVAERTGAIVLTSADITDASVASTPNRLVLRDASGNFAAGTITATLLGSATSATKLTTARTIGLTGDATASISFDGSANASGALALTVTGVAAGSYGSGTAVSTFSVDAKGRLTAAGSSAIAFPVASVAGRTGAIALTSADLTDATSTGRSLLTAASLAAAATAIGLGTGNTPQFLAATLKGSLTISPAGNAEIELGRVDGVASSPVIDFHSGATAVDFDARISASGGTGSVGGGALSYAAATHTFSGAIIGNLTGAVTGNASSATKLANQRTLSLTGDATASISFDGSANASGALTLASTTVTPGSYGSSTSISTFVVDAKGRLTSAGAVAISFPVASVAGRTGAITLSSADITDATSANTPGTIVRRDANGDLSARTITASLTGNASSATKLATARSVVLTGAVAGTTLFDGSANLSLATTLSDGAVRPKALNVGSIASNLLVDGDLIQGLDAWSRSDSARITLVSDGRGPNGNAYVALNKGSASSSTDLTFATTDFTTVEGGGSYVLSGWINGDIAAVGGLALRVIWYKTASTGGSSTISTSDVHPNGAIPIAWTKVVGLVVAPNEARFARIEFVHLGSSGVATAYIAALKLVHAVSARLLADSTSLGRDLLTTASQSAARTSLGLGGAATLGVGTSAGTVAAGDDGRLTGALQRSSNLGDLANAASARGNLGLGPTNTVSFAATNITNWIELGRTDNTASTPYIDFHSGSTSVDFDARIFVSGGNGQTGGGNIDLTANRLWMRGGGIMVDGEVHVGVGQTASYLRMYDTDDGIRTLHNNSGTIGFLNKSNDWTLRTYDDGRVQTAAYGMLHDFFVMNTSAVSANTANSVVRRNNDGSFDAGAITVNPTGTAVLTLHDKSAPTTSYAKKQIVSSSQVDGGDAFLFRKIRGSDNSAIDYELNGPAGRLWHSGNLTPATRCVPNAKDYGLKLDGTTNDGPAYTAARNATGRNGIIDVPAGPFRSTSAITGTDPEPKLWRLSGNSYDGGPVPVINVKNGDVVETFFDGVKYFGRTAGNAARPNQTVLRVDGVFDQPGVGNGNVPNTMRVNTTITAQTVKDNVWGLSSVLISRGANVPQNPGDTVGQHLALNGTVFRPPYEAGETVQPRSQVWAGYLENNDQTNLPSHQAGSQVGLELDVFANDVDPNGYRINLQMVGGRSIEPGAGGKPSQIGYAINVSTANDADSFGTILFFKGKHHWPAIDLRSSAPLNGAPAIALNSNHKINWPSNPVAPSGTGDSMGIVGDMIVREPFIYYKTSSGWYRIQMTSF